MRILLVTLLFILTSCASYVQSIHRQIKSEQMGNRQSAQAPYPAQRQALGIQNPRTLRNQPSMRSNPNYMPNQRQYNSGQRRRYKAEDLKDKSGDGSLWSGKNSENFLFVTNNLKKRGDIVIIEVQKELKDQIQSELKRAFPERKKPKAKEASAEPEGEAAAQGANTPAPENNNDPEKVYDKISTTVIEQVNNDYLLVSGRKEAMYKKYKRYFEIRALVSQKDISSNDTVKSIRILEPKIKVLRY